MIEASPSPAPRTDAPARHSLLVRVLLTLGGGLTALAGIALVALTLVAFTRMVRGGFIPLTTRPLRAVGAVALAIALILFFAMLVPMGIVRVIEGMRGSSGPPSFLDLILGAPRLVHIYVSKGTRRGLGITMTGLLAIALIPMMLGRYDTDLSPFLLGAATVSLVLLLLARTPDQECALCGTEHARVRLLMAGPSTSVCDQCAGAAMAHFAEHFEERDETSEWCRRLLPALPRRCPRAISRPFIKWSVGQERHPARVRNAVAWCFRLGNEPLARELLESLPDAERQPSDWLNLGVALADEERFEEALRVTAVAAAKIGDAQRPWILSNTAWLRARQTPDAPESERSEWLHQVQQAQQLLEEQRPDQWRATLSSFCGAEADLRLQAGDPEGALRALARAEECQPWTADQHLVRARALARLGRDQEAREALGQARRLAHPEGLTSREAEAFLATLPPK